MPECRSQQFQPLGLDFFPFNPTEIFANMLWHRQTPGNIMQTRRALMNTPLQLYFVPLKNKFFVTWFIVRRGNFKALALILMRNMNHRVVSFQESCLHQKKVHLVYHLKMISMRLSLTAFLCNYRLVCMHWYLWCSSFTYFLCCVETCWSKLCCGPKGGKKLFIEERFISMENLFLIGIRIIIMLKMCFPIGHTLAGCEKFYLH